VRHGVVVEDNPRIKEIKGIENGLDLTHQSEGRRTPLLFDKRCHIATGAVFRLEGAVVFFNDQLDNFVHEIPIAHHFRLDGKILGKDEMEIAVQSVAEDDRLIITIFLKEALQINSSIGQVFTRKSNIFNDNRGPSLAHRTNRRKQSFTNLPQGSVFSRNFGESDGTNRRQLFKSLTNLAYLGRKNLCPFRSRLYQKSCY